MSERDDINEQAFHAPAPAVPSQSARKPGALRASDGFDFLLGLQAGVEHAWNRQVNPRNPEAVSKYISEVILCATDELHEVLAEVNWKPWKESRGIKDIEAYREEMADVLHFILDLYLAAGLSGKDIVLDYMSKNQKNLERSRNAEYRAGI